jgi:hypothetical protein
MICYYLYTLSQVSPQLGYQPFNAEIKSLHATQPGEIFLLGILLPEPCISLINA